MASTNQSPSHKGNKKPARGKMPTPVVREFRKKFDEFKKLTDADGRRYTQAKWGVYAFYDYDGEPIYVGQTKEQISTRLGRHLTNQ